MMLRFLSVFRDRFFRTHPHLLIALLLIAATLAVFWQVTGHSFVVYDDETYVTFNLRVQDGLTLENIAWSLTSTYASNWHPLTWISHMADYELYELNPLGHHVTSLLLHMANVLLLFLVLRRMTKSPWKSGFVAALFAIHPLHVESVAWVAERKDVLSTLFWILTMGAYVLYAERPVMRRYLVVVLLFALGLTAKPMLVTLPFVLLLLDYWPLRRLRQAGAKAQEHAYSAFRLILEKVPLFVLAAASCAVTYHAQQAGGSMAPGGKLPISIRSANALVAYIGYIGKMLWPRGLAALYPYSQDGVPAWQVAGSGLLLACIFLLVLRAARRRPYLAVGWLWYVATLVPVIGLVQVGEQTMADRYTYVPLIGLFIAVAWGVPDALRRGDAETRGRGDAASPSGPSRHPVVLPVLAVAVIAVLMVCSWIQVGYWRDSFTLCKRAIAVTQDNYSMHINLAVALTDEGRYDKAIEECREAIRILPDDPQAHSNLAIILYVNGQYAEAWEEVHICEGLGFPMRRNFLDRLSLEMPDPY